MYLNDYENVFTINNFNNAFAKILMKGNQGDILYNTYVRHSPLIFDIPRKGRIDTSCVVHKFDLCVKNGLWKDRNEGGYAHDFEFFNRISNEFTCRWKATKQCTLIYNTEFNGQSFNQLISM